MDQIARIDRRLKDIESSWAAMGRAIGASDQRMNNWRSRGSVSKGMESRVANYLGRSVDWLKSGDAVNDSPPAYVAQSNADPIASNLSSIESLLDQLREQLSTAPPEIRQEVNSLVLKYMESPAETGARIAQAIRLLLEEATHDAADPE